MTWGNKLLDQWKARNLETIAVSVVWTSDFYACGNA
jgi:hypothetical protein